MSTAQGRKLAKAVRATLGHYLVDNGTSQQFDHAALLAEMEHRKGEPLTDVEQRDLARLVTAYLDERGSAACKARRSHRHDPNVYPWRCLDCGAGNESHDAGSRGTREDHS